MPRRYRPPTRRRRSKKPNLPDQPAAPQAPAGGLPEEIEQEEDYEAEALPYEDEDVDEAAYEPAPVPVVRRHDVRHVMVRDHSHVLADLQRIAVIGALIMGGILITAILR